MSDSVLKDLLKEYEIKRLHAEQLADEKKDQLFKKYPELEKINSEIAKCGLNLSREKLQAHDNSKIDVLKIGHHGSKTSSDKNFIDEMNPKYSVISVGKNNRYGHPNKEVLNDLKQSKVYRTDQDGSIMFKIKKNKLRIETYSP